MQHYSHLATATNILWKLIVANGHDPEALYRDVGIDPDLLNKPGVRVPSTLVNSFWVKASEIIDDPCFGLKAAKYWHPSYFHALGYAWLASHTLRDALNRFIRYLRIVSEKIFLKLEEDPDGLSLVCSFERLGMRVPAQIDMGMAMSIHICRLNLFPITVPPLRERIEDISLLAEFFVEKVSKRLGKSIELIPASVMNTLRNYPWPGNVRELENVMERAVISSSGPKLRLAEELKLSRQDLPPPLKTMEAVEFDHILRVLELANWKVSGKNGAAEILGLKRGTLRARMQRLGIRKP